MLDRFRAVVRPVVTEKSSAQYAALREYTFEADPRATKPQIREAIESMFGVKVTSVRTMQQRSKRRTRGRSVGRRPRWKKALVRLAEGDTIEIFEG
ncbi:MAG: 50S ribosomal protein L23 [Gemmatimonadota bacterium]|jgi:large subunit ribosomal protein L23|nr:50S ribosomal protein L23 [Gemmatimonadota bacterium]MDH3366838.1 50S ribosomal protein L23 [Gemmatimonadota bacterium]MDH3477229.1 50S ribosomal protein L23 [Gemmatimonadota bacterium]MDH5551061.1 50S ribosomal protein L23 [Gemmatimonadota bacterium]